MNLELPPLPVGAYQFEKLAIIALGVHLTKEGYTDIRASVWPEQQDRRSVPPSYGLTALVEELRDRATRPEASDRSWWREEAYGIYYDWPGTVDLVAAGAGLPTLYIDAKGIGTRSNAPALVAATVGSTVLRMNSVANAAYGILLPRTSPVERVLERIAPDNPVLYRADLTVYLVDETGRIRTWGATDS